MKVLWISAISGLVLSGLAKFASDAWLHARIPLIGDLVGLTPAFNKGIAFGVQFGTWLQLPLIIGALVFVGYLASTSERTPLNQAGFGLIIGGALANLLDRLPDGLVTDFFQVGSFPIFNVADSCITVGVCLLLLAMASKKPEISRDQTR